MGRKSKGLLFGYLTPQDNKEATRRCMLALKKYYGVESEAEISGGFYVQLPFFNKATRSPSQRGEWNSYEIFTITDNGGEINVEPVNHQERMRSIPYTSQFFRLTAETIAYRLFCAMSNQEIDYSWNNAPSAVDGKEPLKIYPRML